MSLVPSDAKLEGKLKNKEIKVLDEDTHIEVFTPIKRIVTYL